MKRYVIGLLSLTIGMLLASQVEAFTEKQKKTFSVSSSGVTESTTFSAGTSLVAQNTGVPGTPVSALSFTGGANDLRDSGAAIKIDVTTNLAGNRIVIYTDNHNASASPRSNSDPTKGADGAGLVGQTVPEISVPLMWAISPLAASTQVGTNPDFDMVTAMRSGQAVFVTDLAHVATYVDAVLGATAAVTEKQKLDTLPMKECISGVAVPNPTNAGTLADPYRYPQYFGAPLVDKDLCNANAVGTSITITNAAGVSTTIAGCGTTVPCLPTIPTSKIPFSEELSKNIAVVAFGCGPAIAPLTGTACNVPNLATPDPTDSLTAVSPFYVPIGADFRTAPAQNYATSTLTVDLITQ